MAQEGKSWWEKLAKIPENIAGLVRRKTKPKEEVVLGAGGETEDQRFRRILREAADGKSTGGKRE